MNLNLNLNVAKLKNWPVILVMINETILHVRDHGDHFSDKANANSAEPAGITTYCLPSSS